MNLRAAGRFLRSTTARLAASYLAIIMALSLAFSCVIYKTSAHELGRQIPPAQLFSPIFGPERTDYHHFFQQRISEGRGHLLGSLIALNLLVLLIGAALSYYLARRTLQPIERAMEAQSRFITDASHELRTPITAMLTGTEVALRKPHMTLAQAKRVIASNTEELVRLKNLSDDLLNLSKQDTAAAPRRPVSLQDVAGEAMNRVLPAARARQIAIQDEVPAVRVLGDAPALAQAVAALLDNAVKYSDKKSVVHLTGRQQEGLGCLSVRDEGAGIAPDDLPHIFDRFYRADPARTGAAAGGSGASGHGIGLAIALKIIEQHQGKITVSSAPGEGSTFTIQVPLA